MSAADLKSKKSTKASNEIPVQNCEFHLQVQLSDCMHFSY